MAVTVAQYFNHFFCGSVFTVRTSCCSQPMHSSSSVQPDLEHLIAPGLRFGISLCRLILVRKVVKDVKFDLGCPRGVWIYTNQISNVLLGTFATLRIATISFVISVCLPVPPRATTWLPVDGFS